MSAAPPPLDEDEVARILGLLAPLAAERAIVLVGGQAVSVWARLLEIAGLDPSAGLLASKDVDFEGSAQAARRAAKLLAGSIRVPAFDDHTPNTGVVIFVDSDGIERKIDFLAAPLGLRARDVRDTAVRVVGAAHGANELPVWVMHPERTMESRVYNVQILKQHDAHAMSQLRASIDIAREWSRRLLGDESVPGRDRVRAVLRLNERIFRKCLGDLHFRGIYRDHGVDPFDAVLADDERVPDTFRQRRFPQMRSQLEQQRKRGQRI